METQAVTLVGRAAVKDASSRIYPIVALLSAILMFSSKTMHAAIDGFPLLFFSLDALIIALISHRLSKTEKSGVTVVILDIFFYDFILQVLSFCLFAYDKAIYRENTLAIWAGWEIFAMLLIIFRLGYSEKSKVSGRFVAWPRIGPYTSKRDCCDEESATLKTTAIVYGAILAFILLPAIPWVSTAISTNFCYGLLGFLLFLKYCPQTTGHLYDMIMHRDALIDALKGAQTEMSTLKASLSDIAKANNVFDKASALAVLHEAMTPKQKTALAAISVIDTRIADQMLDILIAASLEAVACSQVPTTDPS